MGKNMTFIKGRDKTAREIVRFLEQEAVFCSFRDMLLQFCAEEDIAGKLTAGLAEMTGEGKESVSRKVNNWMQGRNLPGNRETLFRICFALGLGEQESSRLLGRVSDSGIHYRNPEELAYAFALRTGMGYREAEELKGRALSVYREERENSVGNTDFLYTAQLRNSFAGVENEEEFMAFIREHGSRLGRFHETAYRKFMELLDYLQRPENLMGETEGAEKEYTVKQVIREYIRMNVPTGMKKQAAQEKAENGRATLRRMVRKYWPNESMLVKMRTRKADVSRKVLLLLYLATEDYDMEDYEIVDYGMEDYGMKDYDGQGCGLEIMAEPCGDWERDADLRLEMRIEKMNLFLSAFGMNRLDVEQPFDFLVVYSMKADGEDAARERMEKVLAILFGEEDG